MIVRSKSEKINFDTVISVRDVDTNVETMVVQVSVSYDIEIGSVQSFTNVINKEIYLANKKEINSEIEALKKECEAKVEDFGIDIIP